MVILWKIDFYVYFAIDDISIPKHISARSISASAENATSACRAFPKTAYSPALTAPTLSFPYFHTKDCSNVLSYDINFKVNGATARFTLN